MADAETSQIKQTRANYIKQLIELHFVLMDGKVADFREELKKTHDKFMAAIERGSADE